MIDREAVWNRAGGRCEYCRVPLSFVHARPEVDHIRARQHGGGDDLSNLALACLFYNSRKGPNAAGFDDDGTVIRLFNPRTDAWGIHFRFERAAAVGLTAIGRVTIAVLGINAEASLSVREALMSEGVW